MKRVRALLQFLALLSALGCSSAHSAATFPDQPGLVLSGSDGRKHDVFAEVRSATLSVFVFYSEACPCVRAHEPRLREIQADFAARGVAVLLVDSELSADEQRDRREASLRGYPFPLLTDPGARLANAVHAEYATHAVVVDASGRIRYSGGIDSDKNRLHPDAKPYLREALEALLAGREPRTTDPEPLGCALQTH